MRVRFGAPLPVTMLKSTGQTLAQVEPELAFACEHKIPPLYSRLFSYWFKP